MAGDLAAGGASHAIADDEGAVLGQRRACILIGVADAASMGEHGVEKRWCVRGGGGCNLRLGRLQSRSVSHFVTDGARNSGSLKRYSLPGWSPMDFCVGKGGGKEVMRRRSTTAVKFAASGRMRTVCSGAVPERDNLESLMETMD